MTTINATFQLFQKATSMQVNITKSTLSPIALSFAEMNNVNVLFHFHINQIDYGLKYLGVHLKLNDYQKTDWLRLLEKLENILKVWSHKWISRAR